MSKEARGERQQIEAGLEDYEAEKESWENMVTSIRERVYQTGHAEDFYAETDTADFYFVERQIAEASLLAEQALQRGDFAEVVEIGKGLLEACGIEGAKNASPKSPSHAVALSEATNWASKTVSYEFYRMKPLMIVASSQLGGVHFGIGEDSAYYLGTESIGVASFHDPHDEIGYWYNRLGLPIPQWQHQWSGVERQGASFYILEDLGKNDGLAEEYAKATSPEEFMEIRRKYLRNAASQRLTTIGSIIESANKEK